MFQGVGSGPASACGLRVWWRRWYLTDREIPKESPLDLLEANYCPVLLFEQARDCYVFCGTRSGIVRRNASG